ncbi:histidinol dehydrogenase [Aestuariibius sp. 2305UL40-4]|uniref:histidinol dehydrogenase n=1 Tax=Aestuariibius violaceus TaxID=3234132 RepID=UPI00345EFD84
MSVTYLKKSVISAEHGQADVRDMVQVMLSNIRQEGDEAALRYAEQLDGWDGPAVVSGEELAAAGEKVSQRLRDDIQFAHDNIRRFAEAQKATLTDCEIELHPGFVAGQKSIPVGAAGCYVPGGRYSHIASALMTITTAKVAGVEHITACSPPKPGIGVPPAILYTMHLAGADAVLNMGGVQGVAAMAFGLFGLPSADILVGPGNQYVAEAKRMLFGEVGIDMFAGPTDSMVVADETADPYLVAWDLVGQAEHGYNSPVWLVTSSRPLAEEVMRILPDLIADLPETNRMNATAAWTNYADVILCDTRDEMAQICDEYGPEHLHIQCAGLDWWLARLRNYGSLFLGEETTVAFGDKSAGPNHVLPTSGAARYTGGLSVHKFMKTVTWQRATQDGMRPVAEATARLSRLEGMEGHARTADIRLEKFFPDEIFQLSATG